MNIKDYYEILGLTKDSTEEDIKKAYRKLAMQHHPDRNQGSKESEETFKGIQEAYEILSDEDKRRAYDANFARRGSPFSHQPGPEWDVESFKSAFSTIFKNHQGADIFGAQGKRQEQLVINISLQDAYIGCTVRVGNITLQIPKGIRSGTRLFVDSKMFRVDVQQDRKFKRSNDDLLIDIEISAIEAMLGVDVTFDHLDGVTLQFTIPAGIQSGQVVKLGKKGMMNPETSQYGDMMVRVSVSTPRDLTEAEQTALRSVRHRESINL